MKIFKWFLLTAILSLSSALYAQDQQMTPEQAAAQKAWEDYMTPGDMHKILAQTAGEWNSSISVWMSPDAPPMTTDGTSKFEMILGGRYMKETHTGNFMGMPYEGMGLTAYDNDKKTFYATYIDNMGTGVMNGEGTYNPETKTLEIKGKFYEPTQKKDVSFRSELKFVDANKLVYDMYSTMDGKEVKSMEAVYTKK